MEENKEESKFIAEIAQALDMTVELAGIIPGLNFGENFVGHARWPADKGKGDFELVVYTAQKLEKGFGPVRNNAWWVHVNQGLATPVEGLENKGGVASFPLASLSQSALDYLGMSSYVKEK